MLKIFRNLLLAAFCLSALASCQYTNLTDLIDYSRIPEDKLDQYQREYKLRFSRKCVLLDSLDQSCGNKTLAKGTRVTLLGYWGHVGGRILKPEFFRENYTPVGEYYLVRLKGGQRVLLELPETAIGVPGKDGTIVTDVKEKPSTCLFLYKTSNSDKWTDNPGIKYDAPKDIAVYHPRPTPKKVEEVENPTTWQKCAIFVLKLDNFFTRYNLNRLIYKRGIFYSYHPLLPLTTFWARVIQAVLSWLLVFPLLVFLMPKLALESVWHIRFLPNPLVKFLAFILSLLYAYFLGSFLGVTLFGGFMYMIMMISNYTFAISLEVDWERCPYCHHLDLGYISTEYGEWQYGESHRDREEEKSRSVREYDNYTGVGVEHVHETIREMGIKRYTTMTRSRTETTRLCCRHCGKDVTLHDREEHTTETSEWK